MTTTDRFWAKVDKTGQCWLWTGYRNADGYGRVKVAGRTRNASRVSWALHFGAIPPGLNVLHHCDNPPCVNPSHLFLGTQKANGVDMATKGRAPHSKLTPHQVRDIRLALAAGGTHTGLARTYGVSRSAISMLASGKTWTDIA